MRLFYSPQATRDLTAIAVYLQPRSPGGMHQVMLALRNAITFIAEHPYAARATNVPSVHIKIVREYPFKIFYRVLAAPDEIEILHIRHAAREPWSIE